MQRIILVFGAISGAVCFAVFVTGATMAINSNSAEASGVLGYLIMLVALSVIFVGIKRYRDREFGGVIRFGQAFLVGLGISLVAGVIYVVCWEVYLKSTGYTFIGEYTQAVIEGMKDRKEAAKALHLLLMGNLMSGDNFRMWSAARELAHFTDKNAKLFTKEEIVTIAGKPSTATDDVLEELLRTSLDNLGYVAGSRSPGAGPGRRLPPSREFKDLVAGWRREGATARERLGLQR